MKIALTKILVIIALIIIIAGVIAIVAPNTKKSADCRITSLEIQDKYTNQMTDLYIPIKVKISNFGNDFCEVSDIGTVDLWKSFGSGGQYPELNFWKNPSRINPSETKEYELSGYLTSVDISDIQQNSGNPKPIKVVVNFNKNFQLGLTDSYVIRIFK